MADHFEKAKDDILLRTEGNGGPSNRDMLKALAALAEDQDDQHKESMQALAEHKIESDVRDAQIAEINEWRTKSAITCVERMTTIAKQVSADVHGPMHEIHLAKEHAREQSNPADSRFLEVHESTHPGPEPDPTTILELVKSWTLFKKITWLVVSTAITGLLLFTISYYGSLWASNRAEQAFVHKEATALPTPTVTITVTPQP